MCRYVVQNETCDGRNIVLRQQVRGFDIFCVIGRRFIIAEHLTNQPTNQ
jgi:hypothetical protein